MPILNSLRDHHHLHILCLSDGDADGLGSTRSREILKAAAVLGIAVDNARVINDDRLVDGMKERWPHDVIQNHTHVFVKDFQLSVLLTFDGHGVSGHPNHCAVANALANISV